MSNHNAVTAAGTIRSTSNGWSGTSTRSLKYIRAMRTLLEDLRECDLTGKVEYNDEEVMGSGGYSEVFRGRRIESGEEVAVKRLRIVTQDDPAKVCVPL